MALAPARTHVKLPTSQGQSQSLISSFQHRLIFLPRFPQNYSIDCSQEKENRNNTGPRQTEMATIYMLEPYPVPTPPGTWMCVHVCTRNLVLELRFTYKNGLSVSLHRHSGQAPMKPSHVEGVVCASSQTPPAPLTPPPSSLLLPRHPLVWSLQISLVRLVSTSISPPPRHMPGTVRGPADAATERRPWGSRSAGKDG